MINSLIALRDKANAIPMDGVVRRVAHVWADNYDGEGFAVGGWPLLSEYTQRIRAWRGYPREHPIMRQGGGLRRAAIEVPMNFTGKGTSQITAKTRSSDGTPTNITIRTNSSGLSHRAELKISGSKVANQGGGVNWNNRVGSYARPLPARRFWFVNNEVKEKMAEGVLEALQAEMRKLT